MIVIGVDLQNDFMNEKFGPLVVPGSEEIKPNIVKLVDRCRSGLASLWLTADWHREDDAELSVTPDFKTTFPSHCIADTWGAQFIPEIESNTQNRWTTFKKDKFSVWKGNIDFFTAFETACSSEHENNFIVFGVAGDVCVKALLEGMLNTGPRLTVQVVADCIASISKEAFERDIKLLRVKFQGSGHRLFVVNHDEVML
jgi:nicotinamidase/pyrazinamidase